MKSVAGIIECYLMTPGSLADYAATGVMPLNCYMVPIGISDTKELVITDYDPPKDAYGNTLRNKKLFSFKPESFITGWDNLEIIRHHALISRGCDAILVAENVNEYEGGSVGLPESGGSIYWRKNATEGIFFFDYNAKTHFGIGFEFLLAAKKSSIKYDLNVAVGMFKATQLMQAATTNVIRKDIQLPNFQASKQFVLECKAVQYHNGASWVNVMNYEDIADRSFSIKTVENKREHDGRDNVQLLEVNLEVTSDEASCERIAQLWNINQFASIRLLEEHPDGSEYSITISKDTLSNVSDPTIGKDKRQNVFKVSGQVPANRWSVKPSTKQMTLGL
ncbi:MAG: hypothetical protein KF721_04795 [Ignavibacteriaceae bacterium]|nr:hypothetical protein [Ignavibacteriaceae bacterium]